LSVFAISAKAADFYLTHHGTILLSKGSSADQQTKNERKEMNSFVAHVGRRRRYGGNLLE